MKIGLEIHVQLQTKTKLFCGCVNRFTEHPNTQTCDYCVGMPGTKPRLNASAVEYATKIGIALNCSFPKESFFSRKSYFYPDMGKNFQITQYEIPVAESGHLVVGKKKIHIRRIQMEEDPARIVHMAKGELASINTAEYVLVDYNRSGTPLCEIVTEPDFADPKEAREFLQMLSSMLEYMKVYDPEEEGSMRVDANISLGSNRVEVKNISGFKDVEKALNYEIVRQRGLIKRGKKVERETRGWDASSGTTKSQRSKEEEEEYGYIFESDLPRISAKKEIIEKLRKEMPEFAQEKAKRYVKEYNIPKEVADSLTSEPDFAEMFEQVVKYTNPQLTARWFAGPIKKTLNYSTLRMKNSTLTKENIVKLITHVEKKTVTERTAELLLREIVKDGKDIDKLIASQNATRIVDETALEYIVKEVLDENPKVIIDYKSGKKEAFHFLVGQVMRKTHGRGDVEVIRKVLRKKVS